MLEAEWRICSSHEYGSRTLIETLFSHGFCASYTEVRRYLTSIAVHEVENMKYEKDSHEIWV
jgi:hypothetical protein